jgi:hypothetical protein
MDFQNREGVSISVKNGSKRLVYDLVISWRKGTDLWGNPDRRDYLSPGETKKVFRDFPDNLPSDDDKKLFSADVYFRDADRVCWCATPDGNLMEIPPDQMV